MLLLLLLLLLNTLSHSVVLYWKCHPHFVLLPGWTNDVSETFHEKQTPNTGSTTERDSATAERERRQRWKRRKERTRWTESKCIDKKSHQSFETPGWAGDSHLICQRSIAFSCRLVIWTFDLNYLGSSRFFFWGGGGSNDWCIMRRVWNQCCIPLSRLAVDNDVEEKWEIKDCKC